jgi:8-amino-7-oxononanoate synthase
MAWSRRLAELGLRIQAIRPPTVPPGTSRLRIATRADLTDEEVDRAVGALAELRLDVGTG